MSRPSSYKAEFAEQALKLCRLGATDADLAGFFDVSEQTINAWKKAHEAFLESLKAGKALADAEVADKLYRRATGYEHSAVKIVANATTGQEHIVPYTERYPPDTTAAIFWLKNRRPDLWRDKVDHQHGGPNGGPIQHGVTLNIIGVPSVK
jgi:DNA-binding XRE family transcriptional regulator